MTAEQHNTLTRLRRMGYTVRIVRRTTFSVVLINVHAKLRERIIPLRVYVNGVYSDARIESHKLASQRYPTWQS